MSSIAARFSNARRTSAGLVTPWRAIASIADLVVRYSMNDGITFIANSATTMNSTSTDEQPHDADAALSFAHRRLPVPHAPCPQRNAPKRPSSLRLSQMKNALPTMFSSGTNPHTRLSLELSRLSPITK